MTEDDYDMIFKVVIVGNSGVGKSNILLRFLKNEFNSDSRSTVGVEFGSKLFKIEGYKVKAQIWDTAGQERYKSITSAYYKAAKGALLVYDISSRETFENVDKWIKDLKVSGDTQITIILIGNKCDLKERQVSKDEGQNKATQYSK